MVRSKGLTKGNLLGDDAQGERGKVKMGGRLW